MKFGVPKFHGTINQQIMQNRYSKSDATIEATRGEHESQLEPTSVHILQKWCSQTRLKCEFCIMFDSVLRYIGLFQHFQFCYRFGQPLHPSTRRDDNHLVVITGWPSQVGDVTVLVRRGHWVPANSCTSWDGDRGIQQGIYTQAWVTWNKARA